MRLTPYIPFATEESAMKTSTPDIEGCLCAKILAARVWASCALFGQSRTSEVDLTYARNGDRRNCVGVRHLVQVAASLPTGGLDGFGQPQAL